MQIQTASLAAHLQKGLKSLYTLHGDEPLLIQEALDAIRVAARAQGFSERSSHTVSGAHFDWSEVLAAGGSLSLFADKQIVEIRIPSGKPGKEGSPAIQQLAQAAQGQKAILRPRAHGEEIVGLAQLFVPFVVGRHQTQHQIGMAGQIFRARLHRQIDAALVRREKQRRRPCVVHDDADVMLARYR